MSPADASTHKRKASSPEAPANDQHEPKKPRTEAADGQQHAEDCEDPSCEGCAEGEVVLQFETKPSAVDLFQMAREEVAGSKPGSGESAGMSRMAKALFDKAIEEFEALDKAHAHIDLKDGSEDAAKALEIKLQHAACMVAVGNAMPSSEMLQEGTRMFEQLDKTMEHLNGSVLVGLGIAAISQARDLRKQTMKKLTQEDDEDDDEPSEEQREAASLISEPEAELADQAIQAFNSGLVLLKTKIDSYAQESIRAAQELEEYGVSFDLKLNADLARKVFDSAVKHLEHVQSTNSDLIDSNADVLTIYGSCLYSKARLVDNQNPGDQNPATTFVEKAINLLSKAEELQDGSDDAKTLEALGQAYLMSTNLVDDEDVIMERFDAATEKLSRALELDPDNDVLREQVDALQGSDNEEGNGYEDEYEGSEDEEDDEGLSAGDEEDEA